MFSWLKAVGHFFSALFGKSGDIVKVILHDISSFVNLAKPIVAELALIAKLQPVQSDLVKEIEKWLGVYIEDAAKVGAWVAQAETLPYLDVLRSAATLALSALLPAGTASSIINLAIELAYNIFKREQSA